MVGGASKQAKLSVIFVRPFLLNWTRFLRSAWRFGLVMRRHDLVVEPQPGGGLQNGLN